MGENQAQQLRDSLEDWESHYLEVQQQLTLSDLYMLWLRRFRLSRRLIKDYNALIRSGRISHDTIAYTGETKRLV
jgi:hypothetical protein